MKFYMTEREKAFFEENHTKLWESIKDDIELYEPYERTERLRTINKQMNDKLGALAVEYGYRVAENPEVSGLRGLGFRPDKVIFDEAHNLSEVYDSGGPDVVAQKWVEHRRICARSLLECLSGETH
jgi:hypothetical protein